MLQICTAITYLQNINAQNKTRIKEKVQQIKRETLDIKE